MRLVLIVVCVLSFCSLIFSGPNYLQQTTAVGNSFGAIDDVFPFNPSPGNTYVAVISHPDTTTIDDVSGDDGSTHLHKVQWSYNSGIVIEVWKANNVNACCKNFHVGFVGADTVVVNFAEWAQN